MTDSAWERLSTAGPVGRLEAVEELVGKVKPEDKQRLLQAAAKESVAQVQRGIIQLVDSLDVQATAPKARSKKSFVQSDLELISRLEDLGAIIGHELRSIAGVIEMSAEAEIPNFRESRTSAHISRLSERINAVVKLAQARSGVSNLELLNIDDLIAHALAPDVLARVGVQDQTSEGSPRTLLTDQGLVTMLVECAARNAVESSLALDKNSESPILSFTIDDRNFQITITNRFLGNSFELKGIRSAGRTTKSNHTGTGLRIIQYSAETLGYKWSLTGAGGVATFVVSGSRGV